MGCFAEDGHVHGDQQPFPEEISQSTFNQRLSASHSSSQPGESGGQAANKSHRVFSVGKGQVPLPSFPYLLGNFINL